MEELLRLLDDARADERRAARQQERWLTDVDREGASLAGTLIDLLERRSAVSIRTDGGAVHHGRVRLVGSDFCVLGTESGGVWLSLAGMTTVRPHPDERHGPASGDRAAIDLRLAEALARIAIERPRLGLVLAGGDRVSGELRSVGADVATLRLDGEPPGLAYVALPSVRVVFRSG